MFHCFIRIPLISISLTHLPSASPNNPIEIPFIKYSFLSDFILRCYTTLHVYIVMVRLWNPQSYRYESIGSAQNRTRLGPHRAIRLYICIVHSEADSTSQTLYTMLDTQCSVYNIHKLYKINTAHYVCFNPDNLSLCCWFFFILSSVNLSC